MILRLSPALNTEKNFWRRKKGDTDFGFKNSARQHSYMNEAGLVLIICGPTGSGKSNAGLILAEKIGGEIIPADAFQFYRGLDLGTAKPTVLERNKIPHHLIDCLSPEENANAHWYAEKVRLLVPEIIRRKKVPILVGGSGLYLRAVLDGFFEVPEPAAVLEARKQLLGVGPEELFSRLQRVDPEAAARIHPNDTYRLGRALEVYLGTGKPISTFRRQDMRFAYPFRLFGIYRNREELYLRIERRVEEIFRAGFPAEVKALRERYDFSLPAFEAIGYREAAAYLSGEISLPDVKKIIKQKTRNYAKRQMTWFRKEKRIQWLNFSGRP
ncbi:MAG: tRNA (adenosine(37)-N6)-dimethylallyltransferase MiaA [Candidatus Omnitrophica bacterium]|nr:tRNA (adenosine(37)-N6)-dimethylallyltransferase MiaA [Candidatus Omnitrophota bacterium]